MFFAAPFTCADTGAQIYGNVQAIDRGMVAMMSRDKEAANVKILIVDDVEANRAILEEIIKDMGYTPILAENGKQALELAYEHRPELILSDISMPEMDGYELCKNIKKDVKTKNIPVIFISAFDDPEDIVEGFSLGGQDYVTKPFIPEVVQARVSVHLGLYQARMELVEMNRRLQISVGNQIKQIEAEKKNIIYAIANIAAENSNYPKEHIERLKKNCRTLAQSMQLSPLFEDKIPDAYIDTIELAAPLCDIGNIGIPKELLQKKEELTREEQNLKQSHTEIGAKLLRDIFINSKYTDVIDIATNIARYHHENWDGSGYPNNLKEDEIPLEAQIIAVVDRYCVLTGEEACSKEKALEILGQEAGVKYNPDIYKICSKISRQLC